MNNNNLFRLFLIGFAILSSTKLHAQDPDDEVNIWMQQPVVVDGSSSEWHEPLNNYNTATQLAFALANDQQNLYIIIESLDEMTTGRLLRGGITLNINTAGKKKDGFRLNFLGMQQPPPPRPNGSDSLAHHAQHMNPDEHAPGVNVIQVAGFKHIPDGALQVPNAVGIQLAAAFNKNKDYICELAIPLAQLDLKGDEVKAISYNFKINAANKPKHDGQAAPDGAAPGGGRGGMGGGGMHGGGMGGGMGGGGMGGMGGGKHGGGGMRGGGMGGDSNTKASDFWVKYNLAKPVATFRAN